MARDVDRRYADMSGIADDLRANLEQCEADQAVLVEQLNVLDRYADMCLSPVGLYQLNHWCAGAYNGTFIQIAIGDHT